MPAMTEQELKALRATMPWTEHMVIMGRQTLIKIIDRNGAEVPLLQLTKFVVAVSEKMARQTEKET